MCKIFTTLSKDESLKSFLILASLVTTIQSTFAGHSYYPQSFQDSVERRDLQDEELREKLKRILTSTHQKRSGSADTLGCRSGSGDCYSHVNLGYKNARKHMFGDPKLGHLKKDGSTHYIVDVYCHKKFTTSRETGKIGPMSIPNSNVINCEHTWPQSKFTGSDSRFQKSDLNHLFPTDSRANGTRGNHNFGEVTNGREPAVNCKASSYGNSRRLFQPPTVHQGNVARAMFYFAVRYNGKISNDMERILKKWHLEDPVDDAERMRNEGVYLAQKNRNPFIDYPELVDFIGDL